MKSGRDADGLLQQQFRVIGSVCLDRDEGEEAKRVDVARIVAQHAAVEAFGFFEAAFLLVLGRERHEPPLGRALEAFFECDIRFLAAAEEGKGLAERKPGALERGIEARRALEEWQRFRGAAGLEQQETQVLRRLRERRRGRDDRAQRPPPLRRGDPS